MLPLPQYRHITNPKLKHIYLSFDDRGELIIKSPKVSQAEIEKILLKKATWITKSREKIRVKKGNALGYTEQNRLYFLGESYPLVLLAHGKGRTNLSFDGDTFCLRYHTYDEKIFGQHIDRFYRQEAQAYIPDILGLWAERMGLEYQRVSFRKTKRQWGSCSAQNAISFNTMMMKLPADVIQYIVVHELAHIKHKHHQKSFWAEVAHYMPHYKSLVKELKTYTTH